MILEARNLSYAYKSQKSKQILEHVSLIFEERKFYTIVGESGAGKTTFLSLLAGLDTPTEGDILYNGENIQKRGLNYHRKHHVSLVFQNYNLIDYLTAKENVILGGRKNPEELLEKVNIPKEDWNRSVLQLSGGQQQRVAIARAVVTDCPLILADEPTGNLDSTNGLEVMELLSELNRQGTTVVIVTHSQRDAKYAHRVIHLLDGRIVSEDRIR